MKTEINEIEQIFNTLMPSLGLNVNLKSVINSMVKDKNKLFIDLETLEFGSKNIKNDLILKLKKFSEKLKNKYRKIDGTENKNKMIALFLKIESEVKDGNITKETLIECNKISKEFFND